MGAHAFGSLKEQNLARRLARSVVALGMVGGIGAVGGLAASTVAAGPAAAATPVLISIATGAESGANPLGATSSFSVTFQEAPSVAGTWSLTLTDGTNTGTIDQSDATAVVSSDTVTFTVGNAFSSSDCSPACPSFTSAAELFSASGITNSAGAQWNLPASSVDAFFSEGGQLARVVNTSGVSGGNAATTSDDAIDAVEPPPTVASVTAPNTVTVTCTGSGTVHVYSAQGVAEGSSACTASATVTVSTATAFAPSDTLLVTEVGSAAPAIMESTSVEASTLTANALTANAVKELPYNGGDGFGGDNGDGNTLNINGTSYGYVPASALWSASNGTITFNGPTSTVQCTSGTCIANNVYGLYTVGATTYYLDLTADEQFFSAQGGTPGDVYVGALIDPGFNAYDASYGSGVNGSGCSSPATDNYYRTIGTISGATYSATGAAPRSDALQFCDSAGDAVATYMLTSATPAATCTWTAASATSTSANWSTPGNWNCGSGTGNGPPAANDAVVFPAVVPTNGATVCYDSGVTSTVDINNLTFDNTYSIVTSTVGSVMCTGSSSPLGLAPGPGGTAIAVSGSSLSPSIAAPLELASSGTEFFESGASSNTLTISGVVSGAFSSDALQVNDVSGTNLGTVVLDPGAASCTDNAYPGAAGGTTVADGTLELQCPNAAGLATPTSNTGGGTWGPPNTGTDPITIESGATLETDLPSGGTILNTIVLDGGATLDNAGGGSSTILGGQVLDLNPQNTASASELIKDTGDTLVLPSAGTAEDGFGGVAAGPAGNTTCTSPTMVTPNTLDIQGGSNGVQINGGVSSNDFCGAVTVGVQSGNVQLTGNGALGGNSGNDTAGVTVGSTGVVDLSGGISIPAGVNGITDLVGNLVTTDTSGTDIWGPGVAVDCAGSANLGLGAATGGTLEVTGVVSNSATSCSSSPASSLWINVPPTPVSGGTVALTNAANSYGGPGKYTYIGAGFLDLSGSAGNTVAETDGGVLEGSGGTVGGIQNGSWTVAPGSAPTAPSGPAPGTLTSTGPVDLNGGGGGVFDVDITGASPGTGYSQLVDSASSSTTASCTTPSGSATVCLDGAALNVSDSYPASYGAQFQIVSLTGGGSQSGTFVAGTGLSSPASGTTLANGSVITTTGGRKLEVSYTSTGVVLTDVTSPPAFAPSPTCASGASSCSSGTSTTPGGSTTATNDGTTATASGGEGTVTVSQYSSDPVGPLPSGAGAYFDVNLSAGNTFTSVTVDDCNLSGAKSLEWRNGSSWQAVVGDPGPTFSAGPPACVSVTLTSTTSPTLAQLTGTVFGVVSTPPPATTTTSVSASPSSVTAGQAVTYSATVSSATGTPTGTVAFTTGTTTLCTATLSSGTGSCSAANAPVGTDTVTGTYSGDSTHSGSAGTTTLSVAPSTGPPPSGPGYYEVASDGGIFAFNAPFHGSMGGKALNAPIVAIATDPATGGYWEVASDGGIFAFDAPFYGSMGGKALNAPIVGMAATPDGGGYWLVAKDGGIFAFGNASFDGSMGGKHLNAPIVGMAEAPGGGYYEVASDGGIFAFGAAPFDGSMGGQHLNAPVVAMAGDPSTGGYWEVARDGGMFAFDAPFLGSMGGQALNAPIVGMAAT